MDTMNEMNQTDRRIGRAPLGRIHKLVIRVPADVANALRASAMERGTTMNEVINQRLRHAARNFGASQQKTPLTANSLAANAVGGASVKPLQQESNNAESIT